MKFLSLLTILTALLCLAACNKTVKTKTKDTPAEKKKFREDYIYASSLPELKKDSAFYYFNQIATNSKDSLPIAGAYTCMGIIQHDLGDYFGSQESLLEALKVLDDQNVKHHEHLASAYTELGRNSLSLHNYDEAINRYDQAISYAKDDINQIIRLNNKGVAYKEKKQYRKAIDIYDSILLKSKSAPREYARILSNLAYTKWLNDSSYRPAPELWAALQIRKREHDDWGVSASFIHLSDFYTHTRNDSALFYAYQLYNLSKKLRSPDEKLNAISMLIRSEKPGIAQQYFQQYEPLADSIQVARNRAKNQFALIRYETEKYKADKLKLQKENAESKLRIIWWQLALLIGSIIVIIGFILYRRKKQQAIREQQLKTSQKVHDIVANGLYSIIKRIEYGQELEKNQLLDDMDILYEQSRNISYEHPQEITPQTEDQLPSFLKSFATPGTSISIAGYSTALWKRLQPRTQNEVKLAFQNLMINMQKHSQAKNVVIKFERLNQELKIAYTDDGVGLPKNFRYGNGLSSTENRIRSIGGRIIFDSDPGKGLKIQLFIPTE